MYNCFHEDISQLLEVHAPLKPLTNKQIKQSQKPWIDDNILTQIGTKNQLYKHFMQTGDHTYFLEYKTLRNQINHSTRRQKIMYYRNYFNNFRTNIKKFWKGVNEYIGTTKKSNTQSTIIHKVETLNDPVAVADTFNTYFTNVAANLIKKLPKNKNPNSFKRYLKNPTASSMFLNPTSPDEVNKLISNLDSNKATDFYNFPIKIIKNIKDIISEPLSQIYNKSFETGTFPQKLKTAKVTPIHKKGPKTFVENYRPISVLPIFDKILEKIIYKQLISFLNKQNILSENQYGFQKDKSTSLAILDLIQNITNSLNINNFSCNVFLDFAKAFDTVDHTILLNKMQHYGIRGQVYKWFHSYLTNRTQSVFISGAHSKLLNISHGVPQGSILGPILFLLYINDITTCSNTLKFTLFADDTSLLCENKTIALLETSLNNELKNVATWITSNKLSLNINKSNFILFSNDKIKHSINIKYNNKSLERKTCCKYLGI